VSKKKKEKAGGKNKTEKINIPTKERTVNYIQKKTRGGWLGVRTRKKKVRPNSNPASKNKGGVKLRPHKIAGGEAAKKMGARREQKKKTGGGGLGAGAGQKKSRGRVAPGLSGKKKEQGGFQQGGPGTHQRQGGGENHCAQKGKKKETEVVRIKANVGSGEGGWEKEKHVEGGGGNRKKKDWQKPPQQKSPSIARKEKARCAKKGKKGNHLTQPGTLRLPAGKVSEARNRGVLILSRGKG